MAPNVSVTPQPPRREQPPPQYHARKRAAARLATPARDLAPAQGVVSPSSAGGSLSPAVLAPCKSSQRGNVARARSEANAVRSEQTTCAVANHMRRAAVQLFSPCSGALRSARAVRHHDAHMPHPSVCGATRGAVRRAALQQGPQQGSVRSQLSGCSVAVELPLWRALLRPAAQRAVYHRDAHMPRSSARGATSGAARARRRSFAHASRWVGWAPVGCGAGLHLLCACIRPTQTRGRSLAARGGARGGCRACQAKTRLPCRRSISAFAQPHFPSCTTSLCIASCATSGAMERGAITISY